MTLLRWARLIAYLGLILSAIAVLPTGVGILVLPTMSPVVPAMLAFLIGPLAIVCLVLAAILWIVSRARR